jgi:hypothetical protein
MTRKSAAARMTPTIERPRLEPPNTGGLSSRERQIFRDIVRSVKAEHFAAEDVPLIALLARGLHQCEIAAQQFASGSTNRFLLELQASGLKLVDTMTRKLRLGALSRAPHNQRGPKNGTTEVALPLPWQNNPRLYAVDDLRGADGERSFSFLRERAFGDRTMSTC